MNISNIQIHTASNNARYATYTIKGKGNACTFIPKSCKNAVEVAAWLNPAPVDLNALCDSLNTDWAGEPEWRVTLWEKYGKRRVYVKLVNKCNGGKNWNGGIGGKWCIDLDRNGELSQDWSWAGAATRKTYESELNEIVEAIRAAA